MDKVPLPGRVVIVVSDRSVRAYCDPSDLSVVYINPDLVQAGTDIPQSIPVLTSHWDEMPPDIRRGMEEAEGVCCYNSCYRQARYRIVWESVSAYACRSHLPDAIRTRDGNAPRVQLWGSLA